MVELDSDRLNDWERAAFADRLLGIDLCQLWNSGDGTLKLLDENRRPVRIVAKRPDIEALREAVRADQRMVDKRLARHRSIALEIASSGLDPVNFIPRPEWN